MSTTPKHRELVPTRADSLTRGQTVARSRRLSATVVTAAPSDEPRRLTGWVPDSVARLLHLPIRKTVVYLRFTDGETRVRAGRRFQVVTEDAGLIWERFADRSRAASHAAALSAVERRARQLTPIAG